MNKVLLFCLLLTSLAASGQSYWETLKAPDGGAPTKITQTVNGWVYAEFYDGATFCSQDNGLHWQQIFWPSSDPDTGFAKITVGRAGTLFAERRLGANGSPTYFFLDIFKSTDNGDTWQLLVDSMPMHGIGETSTGVLFATKDSFPILGDNTKVVRSYDNGATWEEIFVIPGFSTYDAVAKIDEYNRIVVSTFLNPYNTYFSVDEGQTWHKRYVDLVGFFLVTATGATLSVDSHNYFFRQASGSSSEQEIMLDSTVQYVSGLMLFPDSSIYATTSQYFYKSVDDGLTWERVGPNNGVTFFPIASPLHNGTMLGNGAGDLYRSNDDGASWQFSSKGIGQGLSNWIDAVSDDTIFAKTASGLWGTTNGGEDWNRLTANADLSEYYYQVGNFIVTPAGEIFTDRDSQLLYSPDLGQTFSALTLPEKLPEHYSYIAYDPGQNLLFVNTQKGPIHSVDKGLTWGAPMDSMYLLSMVFHPSGKIFGAFADRHSAWPYYINRFLFSTDGGQTWESVPGFENTSVSSVYLTNLNEVIALAFYKIYKSPDNGSSWVEKAIVVDNNVSPPFLENTFGHYFYVVNQEINGADYVHSSTDGGSSNFAFPHLSQQQYVTIKAIDLSDTGEKLYVAFYDTPGSAHLFRTTNSTLSGTYLSGTVFKDADGDCATSDSESPLANWIVRADGGDTWYTNTDSSGRYTMFLDTGAYFLTVKPLLNVLWETCADSLPVQLLDLFDTTTQDVPVRAIADCPYMTVDVAAPWLERCFENYVFVKYYNLGTEPADSAWVDVTLDPYLIFTDTLLNYEALGNNTFRFQLGALGQGQCGNFYISVYVDCDSSVLGQTLCVAAHVYPDSLCITPPNWSGAQIQVTARCEQDTTLRFDVKNTGTVPTQGLHYFVIEDDVVLMQGDETYQADETKTFSFPANGHFRRFESEQEPGHPFSMQVAAWAEGCGGFDLLGFPNWYFLNNGIPSQDVFCGEIVGAFDPNDKQGFPLGYGAEHLVPPNTDIEYLVRFQNTGTAPAHNVVVRDTLSAFLDPGSLRMGTASHPYTWSLSGQGILTVTFSDINLPDSNANEAASHGFFSFKIAQKPDLPDGTDIRNTASIYFDFNSAIRTNETLHRVGRDFITVDVTKIPDSPGFGIRVFPNPVTETAVLTFTGLDTAAKYRFLLTDISGRVLREMTFDGNALTLRRDGLASGVYFFQILDFKEEKIGGGKLLLR